MEGMERWDSYLVNEHERIERAMAVLKTCLEALGTEGYDARKMLRALDFLLEFGDKIHNVKEERWLFPAMEERGIPVQGGPLGVMLMEHEAERGLLARLMQQAPALAGADAATIEAVRKEGFDYLRIRAEHIWKENDVLYAMGRKVLDEAVAGELLERFRTLDRETYGPEAEARLDRMVEEVEEGGARTRLVEGLSHDQLHAIMEAMPFEVTFVDAEDSVAYFNRLDKPKIFPRTRSVVGRKVQKCHPGKSVDKVQEIVDGFRAGTLDKAEFWINMGEETILIRYFPVYGEAGEYMGVLEVTQAVGWIRRLEGEKRLL